MNKIQIAINAKIREIDNQLHVNYVYLNLSARTQQDTWKTLKENDKLQNTRNLLTEILKNQPVRIVNAEHARSD